MQDTTQVLIFDIIEKSLLKIDGVKKKTGNTFYQFDDKYPFKIKAVNKDIFAEFEIFDGVDLTEMVNQIDEKIQTDIQPWVDYLVQLEFIGKELTTTDETYWLEKRGKDFVIVINHNNYQKLLFNSLEYEFTPNNEFVREEARIDFDTLIAKYKIRHKL